MLDQTAVIMHRDHGYLFGEHGLAGKNFDVYEETCHVPLLIRHPGIAAGRSAALVSLLDVPATVLGIAGVPVPAWMEGRSLLPAPSGDDVKGRDLLVSQNVFAGSPPSPASLPYGQITDGRWSLLYGEPHGPYALYDLCADPAQEHNVLSSSLPVVRRLWSAFLDFLGRHGASAEFRAFYTRYTPG